MQDESGKDAVIVRAELPKDLPGFEESVRIMWRFHSELEHDSTLRDLVITLALYTPRESLELPEYFRYHYFVYARLLQRYLEDKYSSVEKACEKYHALCDCLKQLARLRQIAVKMYQDLGVEKCEQIIAETFNVE